MANSYRGGGFYGATGPLRSREGISSRPPAVSDEIQLRIDPIHSDLDEEITGLYKKIRQLKGTFSICPLYVDGNPLTESHKELMHSMEFKL